VPELERVLGCRLHDGRTTINHISGSVLASIREALNNALRSEPDARFLVSWQFNDLAGNSWKYAGCPPQKWFHEAREFARELIDKKVVLILGASAKIWGMEPAFDYVVGEIRSIFSQCGVLWFDGSDLFAQTPRADGWPVSERGRMGVNPRLTFLETVETVRERILAIELGKKVNQMTVSTASSSLPPPPPPTVPPPEVHGSSS